MKAYLRSVGYLIVLYIAGLLMLSLLRLALFCVGHHFLSIEGAHPLGAFVRGVWFDNVVACYISFIPLVALTISHTLGRGQPGTLRVVRWWVSVLWILAILISCANIPYFLYFFKNINSSIWNWAGYGTTTLGMLFGEKAYYPPLFSFLLLSCLFVWLAGYVMPARPHSSRGMSWLPLLPGIPLIALCLFGIRGRRGYNPIKVSAAYYCNDPFLNQLGVSPAFSLLSSSLDNLRPENKKLQLTDDAQALSNTQALLQRHGDENRPLRYQFTPSGSSPAQGYNVVLIFMESMSACLMHQGHTPFLDSLATCSLYYSNCYSAGLHTNHGLYATLYSYPALMFRNMMKGSNIPLYSGLPTVLTSRGYTTMFFMTHESQYDNMNAFFRTNGYSEIYSQENYPKEKVVNSFGVQDDFLYDYAIRRLSACSSPFFATLLSISNHPPYVIPKYFTPNASEPEWQIVEYADWSLSRFFSQAESQPWYSNTIFVLLGDHGKLIGEADSEMPESLNHIPLMFYIPGMPPERDEGWALQMDVQPTLLGLLGISASQNNFGVDLRSLRRPCAYYTADNVIGARSSDHLFIYNPSAEQEILYRDGVPGWPEDSTFSALRYYVFNTLQAAQTVVAGGNTR
ncbi:MAG: LTA synthase family protein [Prevotellaceae bacterium]|nr:LTA synthase family protein [Prevotellaceae bacterium]